MVEHTPGPWSIGGASGNEGEAREIASESRCVAWTASTWDEDEGDVVTAEDDANARLIAAAPELLAALKLLRDPDSDGEWTCYCDDPHYYGGKCENCIATEAINKAEGRSE